MRPSRSIRRGRAASIGKWFRKSTGGPCIERTGPHDVMTGACRNARFNLNAVYEVDNLIGTLTLVDAELGVSFSTINVLEGYGLTSYFDP